MSPMFANAESEYAKDTKIRKEDVEILMRWIEKEPHLPKLSEFKIILFLQSCYYRIEATKQAVENHYMTKAHCPEFFTKRSLSSVDTIMKLGAAFVLPKPSVNGYSVMFCKLIDTNPDQFNCNDLIKYFDMVVSLTLQTFGSSSGHVLVIDMEGTTFAHIAKININSARKYVYFLQEAVPIRAKEVHILNMSSISQRLINLIKPFLKKEIVDVLHFHDSIDSLCDYIPKEALPKEYGGQADMVEQIIARQRKEFEEYEDFFLEEEKYVADESKRIASTKNGNFGVEGTFKRLEID